MSNLNFKKKTYIYELPYTERKEFCDIIDMNDKWEELGGKYMKIEPATLFRIGKAPMRSKSSTDELLTLWGEQNHTILELFTILYEMQHYQAMIILKPFVADKYHKLIYQGDKSFSNLVWKTNTKTGNNSHNEDENIIKLNTNSNQRSVNKLERKDLSTLGKINEQTYSDPMFSSAEACTPLITYNELEQATDYWNENNILGKGGFGVVFKGKWKNTEVAIKRLETQKEAEQQYNILEVQRQSLRELKYLNSCRHDNILSLYGFSIGGEKPCLVYRYMINGSLEDRLQCRKETEPLTWDIRFKIATGSARGLQFLHGMDKPLIHGDMKSANILLDPCFEPHIGDFGLAREGPLQEYTRVKVVHGTMPYLPDEFLRGKKFSTKVDTYSFGVVLFEIATGQKAYDKFRSHKFLKDHVENSVCPISDMADVKAGPDENNIYLSLMSIGKNCVSYIARDRPEMEQVLRKLDCIMLQDNSLFAPVKRPVPSNQLLKPNTLNLQMEKNNNYCKVSSNPGSTRSTMPSPSINKSISDCQLTNNSTGDSTSTSHIPESGSVEKKNSARNNSILEECEELPLISALQMDTP